MPLDRPSQLQTGLFGALSGIGQSAMQQQQYIREQKLKQAYYDALLARERQKEDAAKALADYKYGREDDLLARRLAGNVDLENLRLRGQENLLERRLAGERELARLRAEFAAQGQTGKNEADLNRLKINHEYALNELEQRFKNAQALAASGAISAKDLAEFKFNLEAEGQRRQQEFNAQQAQLARDAAAAQKEKDRQAELAGIAAHGAQARKTASFTAGLQWSSPKQQEAWNKGVQEALARAQRLAAGEGRAFNPSDPEQVERANQFAVSLIALHGRNYPQFSGKPVPKPWNAAKATTGFLGIGSRPADVSDEFTQWAQTGTFNPQQPGPDTPPEGQAPPPGKSNAGGAFKIRPTQK